ncbi:MAG: cation diffusion facilitator family transporter [Gemmatimonadales bacterium]
MSTDPTPCVHVKADRQSGGPPIARLSVVFGLTALFMIVEAVGGWLSGSLALLADAGHMLTDVGALGLTLLTAWIARRPADQTKTYGYLRWEILAALINGAVLFGLAAWVVVEAIGRINHPEPIQGRLFFAIAAAGLLVNGVALYLLHGQHEGHLNTRGAYLHILGDLLGSVGAVAAAVIVLLTGWTLADPILSVVLSLLILVGAWRLVRESTDVLLEAVPGHISLPEVESRLRALPGVTAVHDLHVWTVANGIVAMSGHAVVPDLASHPDILSRIRSTLAELGILHVTVQLECGDGCEEEVLAAPSGHHDHSHAGHRH